MDLQIACLQRHQHQMEAVVNVLAQSDEDAVGYALKIVAGLGSLAECADTVALQSGVQPPAVGEPDAVERFRRAIARSKALRTANRHSDAQHSLSEAEHIDYEPVASELALERGQVLEYTGNLAQAEREYRRVLELGPDFGQHKLVQNALFALVTNIGVRQTRPEEGLLLLDVLEGQVHHDPAAQARLYLNHGDILLSQGKYEEAAVEFRRTVALPEGVEQSQRISVLNANRSLGRCLMELGRYEEAHREARRALELSVEIHGPSHPAVAESHVILGSVLNRGGQFSSAEAEQRRALELFEAAVGADNVYVAKVYNNLGNTLSNQSKYEEAVQQYRRALEIWRKGFGPDHPDLGHAHNNMGVAFMEMGNINDAEVQLRLAVKLWSEGLGPKHPSTLDAKGNIARILNLQGKTDESLAQYRESLEALEELFGPEHPAVIETTAGIAAVLMSQGHYRESEAEYRRILPKLEELVSPTHSALISAYQELSMVVMAQGRYEEADARLRKTLDLALEGYGADSSETATTHRLMAENLRRLYRLEEAQRSAEQVWAYHQRDQTPPEV